MGSLQTKVGMDGLNANVIVWVNVNGTTKANQQMNSFIASHQEPSDGMAKRLNQPWIYSTLESNQIKIFRYLNDRA